MPSTRSKSSEVAEQVESVLAEETKGDKKVEGAGDEETIAVKTDVVKATIEGDSKDNKDEDADAKEKSKDEDNGKQALALADDIADEDDDDDEEEAKSIEETDDVPSKDTEDSNNVDKEVVDGEADTKAEKRAIDITDAKETPEKKAKLDAAADVEASDAAATDEKPNNGVQEAAEAPVAAAN